MNGRGYVPIKYCLLKQVNELDLTYGSLGHEPKYLFFLPIAVYCEIKIVLTSQRHKTQTLKEKSLSASLVLDLSWYAFCFGDFLKNIFFL